MTDQDGDHKKQRSNPTGRNHDEKDEEDCCQLEPSFHSLLSRIIEDVNDRSSLDAFTEKQLHWVLDAAIEVLKPLPALIHVNAPVVIFGDIHGHLADLRLFLQRVGRPPTTKLLFLGDYADRGGKGLEVLFLLLAMKLLHPQHVDLLRGNHETSQVNTRYGLLKECRHKFSVGLWNKLRDLFFELPLCARVGKRILAMHGGISETLRTWDDFAQLKKCHNERDDDETPAVDLMWADPGECELAKGMFEVNTVRGTSVKFGSAAVERLITSLDIDLIVRAHQLPTINTGHQLLMGDRLCTIFSASNYCGENNSASVMHVSGDFDVHFTSLNPDDSSDDEAEQ